ncbi:MAG TPA: hypothetical protein VNJ54_16290 [Plantibacter sp.]|uniref:hypothetical protein n=1 Tax=Plantibacter sp. TaxID=1871045 RepID=UPI002C805C4B|nr:hypothetical protein [Plantibacter sp.]
MSEYVVHFTKPSAVRSAYDVMISILSEGVIRVGGPFGAARNVEGLGDSQRSACFSEIPLDLLYRLVERRSLYGIGFRQDFLMHSGGARVWYLDKGGLAATAFQGAVYQAQQAGVDTNDPIWRLTPFVDFPGDYGGSQYQFEWEREWRVPHPLPFQPGHVAFLFLPEEFHLAARGFFEEAQREHTGAAYLCPYVDPRWTMDQIQQALAPVPTPPSSAPTEETTCPYCGGPVADGQCMLCHQPA